MPCDLMLSDVRSVAVPLLCALAVLAAPGQPPAQAAPASASITATESAVVLQNQACRWEIGAGGATPAPCLNLSFTNLADGTDYCEPGQPFMQLVVGGKTWPATAVTLDSPQAAATKVATVAFGASGLTARVKLEAFPEHFALTVLEVTGGDPDWLQLANLRLKITANVGPLVNAAWDEHFGACVMACNNQVDARGADSSHAFLRAHCYREYGLQGARVAVLAVPTGGPDPATKLLAAIGRLELAEGLPHPMRHGVWIKQAPERFASYLMAYGAGEEDINRVIAFARGGFGCIELNPWASTPTYGISPKLFPHGLAGLKETADKIHAAGLMVGLHTMQGMVGWGPKDDPYLVPKADPRLLQDKHVTLAAALDGQATQIAVRESVADWPDRGDLYAEGEIIRYTRKTDQGFADCQRGLWGTTVGAHVAGAPLGHLVNCFDIWGYTIYAPDIKTTMLDEICGNLARAFNAIGADMSYFDAGEEVAKQPPAWHNQGRVALEVSRQLKQPVLLGGNAIYTQLSWHVITRGSPHFDQIYFGRREYTLRFKGINPAGWAKNLLTGDVGWFQAHTASPTTDAVTPDEMMLLCLKAVAGPAPISLGIDTKHLWANKRMPEMLEIIQACDELKRRDYFTEAARAALAKPRAEHVLEQRRDGQWDLRPLQFGPTRALDAAHPEAACWHYTDPYGPQAPWLRLRARTQPAAYGAKENLVLADCAGANPFTVKESSAADLVPTIEPSAEKTPDGAAAFCYRVANRGAAVSKSCQITTPFAQPLNLTTHRRLGVWVRGDNSGGLLNFQLAGTDCRRDHYVDLNFTGWKYCELTVPEDQRYWDYTWPYRWTDLMATCHRVYSTARELNVFYNALPAGATAACLIGRVEALQESRLPLRHPSLQVGDETLTFPVSLLPDEYLETGADGRTRHFDANGGLLGEVQPQGALHLNSGDNTVRLACETGADVSTHAEVTFSVKGEPLAGARRSETQGRAGGKTRWYPALMPNPGAAAEPLQVLPGDDATARVVFGSYELAGGAPHHLAALDGKGNAWEVANPAAEPMSAVVTISRGPGGINDADPRAMTLETFDDLSGYELSTTNRFEKYVLGDAKKLAAGGPAREGVTQSLTGAKTNTRVGASCAVYTVVNSGGAGGWCAQGRRFARPLDLSAFPGLALWLEGDGKGEVLKLQLRDTAGRYLDWPLPVDYTGWRLHSLPLSRPEGFDLKQVEYVIWYYNNLPAGATCTVRLDDLKALPAGGQPAPLGPLSLVVDGRSRALPVTLRSGETLAIHSDGGCSLWRDGARRPTKARLAGGGVVLQPGVTRFALTCSPPPGASEDISVRVLPLRPAGRAAQP